MFDFGLLRLKNYNALEQEKLFTGAIALYEYLFGALLGVDLTLRQRGIFQYLSRLLIVVPGATIHTLPFIYCRRLWKIQKQRGPILQSLI
jgi:hypothetical protein